nr:hypothetical protein L204_04741 [Cryptococcus depauperatus CBS 7855]
MSWQVLAKISLQKKPVLNGIEMGRLEIVLIGMSRMDTSMQDCLRGWENRDGGFREFEAAWEEIEQDISGMAGTCLNGGSLIGQGVTCLVSADSQGFQDFRHGWVTWIAEGGEKWEKK